MANLYKSSTIALSAAAAAVLTFTGCGSSGGGGGGGGVVLTSCLEGTVLSGDCGVDVTLTADNTYEIDGLVKVRPGTTLTIEPGTTLFGDTTGDDFIVVMKGAKIIADGTAADPIVFTSKTALDDPAAADIGQWGGLTILGAAPTNHADPRYEVDESDEDFAFGNAVAGEGDAMDDSGVLRHVQVLNSGKTIGTDLEINGLSLAGVGAGTVVEDITVENSSDDCIEIWGGTVNVTRATMTNCQDDSFDLDYGYTGIAQDITVVQTEAAHAGFEISSGGDTPMTSPVIENFSIAKVDGSDEGGIYIKDDTTAPKFIDGTVTTLGAVDAAIHTKVAATAAQLDAIAFSNVTLTAAVGFDGPAATDIETRHTADDATIDTTKTLTMTGDIETDYALSKYRRYEIDGLVKVRPGADLGIEEGTTLFGDTTDDDFIVVMKGATIHADGTMAEPIVFTSKTALDGGPADVGQWGGLTVLGAAPTNHDDPHYEVDESDPDFAFGNAAAGAGDVNDNSGVIRYVEVRNSGKTIGTDLEINGLSLAGVGAGTTVENVTVVNSSDDCIEIWGGTVDVTNAYMENCQDDSFDLDYGYVGTATNIEVVQVDLAHAGFEISSGGTNPMTSPTIDTFTIEKVAGSDEGIIYIKDDSTAPTFINGAGTADAADVGIHTKVAFTQAQKDAMSFSAVTLDPATFDGAGAADAEAEYLAQP